jgi:hypothetical protein
MQLFGFIAMWLGIYLIFAPIAEILRCVLCCPSKKKNERYDRMSAGMRMFVFVSLLRPHTLVA